MSTAPPRPYADAPRLPPEEVDLRALVASRGAPVELEIGPGRGGFLVERVTLDPTACIVGLEIRRKWATLVDHKLRELGHGARCRVFAEDARECLPRFVPGSVRAAFVHFPDPWWKKRHQKRLVIGRPLLDDLCRVLVPGATVFVQTDVEERLARYRALFEEHPAFEPAPGGAFPTENPYGARSPRERRALADGLPIYRLHYARSA